MDELYAKNLTLEELNYEGPLFITATNSSTITENARFINNILVLYLNPDENSATIHPTIQKIFRIDTVNPYDFKTILEKAINGDTNQSIGIMPIANYLVTWVDELGKEDGKWWRDLSLQFKCYYSIKNAFNDAETGALTSVTTVSAPAKIELKFVPDTSEGGSGFNTIVSIYDLNGNDLINYEPPEGSIGGDMTLYGELVVTSKPEYNTKPEDLIL